MLALTDESLSIFVDGLEECFSGFALSGYEAVSDGTLEVNFDMLIPAESNDIFEVATQAIDDSAGYLEAQGCSVEITSTEHDYVSILISF